MHAYRGGGCRVTPSGVGTRDHDSQDVRLVRVWLDTTPPPNHQPPRKTLKPAPLRGFQYGRSARI